MTITEYKITKEKFNKVLDELSKKLNLFVKNTNGGVNYEERKSNEFIQLKKSFDFTFEQYRQFNSLKESKIYSKQIRKEKYK